MSEWHFTRPTKQYFYVIALSINTEVIWGESHKNNGQTQIKITLLHFHEVKWMYTNMKQKKKKMLTIFVLLHENNERDWHQVGIKFCAFHTEIYQLIGDKDETLTNKKLLIYLCCSILVYLYCTVAFLFSLEAYDAISKVAK